MIKLMGAMLVLFSTGAAGIGAVMKLRSRVSFLTALISTLELMKNEVCSRFTPMRDVLECLSEEAPQQVRGIFAEACRRMQGLGEETFSEIWLGAVEREGRVMLSAAERAALAQLGLSLGKYDAEWQLSAFERTLRRFEEFRAEAETVRDRDSKMHAFLGLAAGIFAVIVLV